MPKAGPPDLHTCRISTVEEVIPFITSGRSLIPTVALRDESLMRPKNAPPQCLHTGLHRAVFFPYIFAATTKCTACATTRSVCILHVRRDWKRGEDTCHSCKEAGKEECDVAYDGEIAQRTPAAPSLNNGWLDFRYPEVRIRDAGRASLRADGFSAITEASVASALGTPVEPAVNHRTFKFDDFPELGAPGGLRDAMEDGKHVISNREKQNEEINAAQGIRGMVKAGGSIGNTEDGISKWVKSVSTGRGSDEGKVKIKGSIISEADPAEGCMPADITYSISTGANITTPSHTSANHSTQEIAPTASGIEALTNQASADDSATNTSTYAPSQGGTGANSTAANSTGTSTTSEIVAERAEPQPYSKALSVPLNQKQRRAAQRSSDNEALREAQEEFPDVFWKVGRNVSRT